MTEDEIKALKASRQSRLEGAITPTNGRGGYAPRYSPPPSTVKPPTWDYWRHMPTVKPWQACALALNIEPDSVDYRPESWDGQPETWDGFPSEVRDHFIKLLQLLDANQFEKQHFTENFRMGVRLSEFAAWCAHVGIAIPPELSALATLPERPQVAPKVVAAPVISQSGNGQLTVLIDGREALPVRAIPHVTGWIFHPDKIVFCLKSSSKTRLPSLCEEPHLSKNKKRIYKHEAGATLTAYHIPGNEPVQMKPLEWRGVEVQLKGLESELKLKYGEEGRGNDIGCAEWERATVPVLPAGAFVWLDDFKKFRHWTFNKGDSPDATELMLTPCLGADIRAMVMEGFETLPPAAKGKAAQGTNPGGDDMEQTLIDEKVRTNKKIWDDARLRTLWEESIMPGVTQASLAEKHGVVRQRIGTLLKKAKNKFSTSNSWLNSPIQPQNRFVKGSKY